MTDPREKELEARLKKAQAALRQKLTARNIKAEAAARKALEEYLARKAAEADPGERRFKTLTPDALDYLKSEGWKIEKTKLYADSRLIRKEKDGTYSKKAVDEYAENCLERLDGTGADTGLAAEKAKLEKDILEERRKKLQRENEIDAGLWILKSETEQKHTAKLGLLLNAVDNFIYGGKVEDAVELVGGQKEKAAEMKAFFKKEFRAMLGEYAKRPIFTVPKKSIAEAEELIKEVNAD